MAMQHALVQVKNNVIHFWELIGCTSLLFTTGMKSSGSNLQSETMQIKTAHGKHFFS